jgi:chromosome segregation ATPase
MKDAKTPALFPPGWLELTSSDPKLARDQILHLSLKNRKLEDENSKVRTQRDELERNAERFNRRLSAIALAHNEEQAQVRSSECAHKQTQEKLEALERLRSRLEERVQEAEHERDEAKSDAGNLQRRVRSLEVELRTAKRVNSKASVASTIKKLALNNTVGRRLAAAVHPDKVPTELADTASDLFCFLQTIRESSEDSTEPVER